MSNFTRQHTQRKHSGSMLREVANQATILDAIVIHTTHNRKTFTVLKYMVACCEHLC